MNLLITGGTGFIGKHLVKELSSNHQLHLLIRPNTGSTIPKGVQTIVFDNNIAELHQYILENKIEGIFHLATLFIAQHQANQIKDMILSNVYVGTAVLEAAQHTAVKWVINTGTYWQHFHSEDEMYCPTSLYAASKQAFIDMAAYYTQVSDIKFVTLKLSDSFGDGDTRPKLFTVLKEAIASGKQLQMSPGEQVLDILHVKDIVSGFVHLMKLLNENKILGSDYILAAKQRFTLREVVAIFEKVSGKKINVVWGGRPYRDREIMQPWNKGIMLPEWEAKLSLEEGISLYLSKTEQQ